MSREQLNEEYKNMVAAASKAAFITAVRRNHNASLAEVAEMAEAEGLGDLTVGEVFFRDRIGFDVKALGAPKSAGFGVDADEVSTRRPAERAGYDQNLLDALSAKLWMSAQDLRKAAGGTPLQARKALNRLVETRKIKTQGQARATKYKLRTRKKKKGKKSKKGNGEKGKDKKGEENAA